MKALIINSILAILVASGTTAIAQDYPEEYLGLPGDNLNLYAVMKLFQESETLEGFERSLNDENSRINNLDLNGDNQIDYITVDDYVNGNDHTIVLRVPLSRNESQDVAVFTVQRLNNGSVHIQLIGDEALYGKNYIIEPIYEETPNPGYAGKTVNVTNVTVYRVSPFAVADWPLIRFIYLPGYNVWRSAWYWGYYPPYWRPWTPFYWDYYYGYHYHWYDYYYGHYHHWDHYRYNGYNDFYYRSVRHSSPTVVVNINKNVYRNTYSHPEQRKEGEALYSRLNPDRPGRTSESRPASTGARQETRSSERQLSGGTRGESSRPGSAQRSEPANKPQTVNREVSRSSAGTSRQSSGERQSVSKSGSGQRTNASARTTPSASGRSEYKPAQSKSDASARSSRSSNSSSGRSEYKPAQSRSSQNSRANRSSVQSQKSSSGRSSGENKSSSAKSSGKEKNSDSRR